MKAAEDALREARAALLNQSLSESERATVVKVVEGALFVATSTSPVLRAALELTEEALDIHVRAAALRGEAPDDGDAHALTRARAALGKMVTP